MPLNFYLQGDVIVGVQFSPRTLTTVEGLYSCPGCFAYSIQDEVSRLSSVSHLTVEMSSLLLIPLQNHGGALEKTGHSMGW
jgi:hypothetical protein